MWLVGGIYGNGHRLRTHGTGLGTSHVTLYVLFISLRALPVTEKGDLQERREKLLPTELLDCFSLYMVRFFIVVGICLCA